MGLNTTLGPGTSTMALPYAEPTQLVASRFLDATRSSTGRRQFLVSVNTSDRPGNAFRVCRDLANGIGAPTPFRFSIEESLTAKLNHRGVLNFVVSAVVPPDVRVEAVGPMLEDHLVGVLSPDTKVEARLFEEGSGVTLFEQAEFNELRFGVPRHTSVVLGDLIRGFAHEAARRNVPIAYCYFPFGWSPPPSNEDAVRSDALVWARVAFGTTPTSRRDSLELQSVARSLANEVGAWLAIYKPREKSRTMAERFAVLRPCPAADDPIEPVVAGGEGEIEHVVRPAQPGQLAESLAAHDGTNGRGVVLGSAMGVLRGDAVIDLIVGQQGVAAPASPPSMAPSGEDARRLWIAWRCADSAGVFARVLGALLDLYPEANLEHSMTRVLRNGRTCAGKLLVHLGDDAPADPSVAATELATKLHDTLGQEIENWDPVRAEWKKDPILVGSDEPAESPWAEIVLVR